MLIFAISNHQPPTDCKVDGLKDKQINGQKGLSVVKLFKRWTIRTL